MRVLVVGFTVLCITATTAVAAAQEPGIRQEAKLRFTTERPGSPSGSILRIDYVNPEDRAAKPPAVRRVELRLAKGARFDTSAPERCPASDLELTLIGPSACPAASRVGVGRLTLDTGLPEPSRLLDIGIDFFNAAGELIYLNQPTALQSPRVVLHASVSGRTVVTNAPFLPGTLPDGAAIDTVFARDFVTTREVHGELRSYITTPRRCPPRGYWLNRALFGYADGVTQTVESRSRCVQE